jgi:hypothetical protein
MDSIAILKAVAEKLIPGIPIPTRISILQQTATDGSTESELASPDATATVPGPERQFSVLEDVINRATSRNEIQYEIDGKCHVIYPFSSCLTSTLVLSKAIDGHESAFAPLRALRQVHHDRLKKELFELDKDARLRSGTRGMAARKALIAFEKKVAESAERSVPTSNCRNEGLTYVLELLKKMRRLMKRP